MAFRSRTRTSSTGRAVPVPAARKFVPVTCRPRPRPPCSGSTWRAASISAHCTWPSSRSAPRGITSTTVTRSTPGSRRTCRAARRAAPASPWPRAWCSARWEPIPADRSGNRLRSARPVPDYERQLDVPVRGLRVAVPRGFYDDFLDPEVRAAREESLRVLRELGVVIVETRVPDMDLIAAATHVVMASEAATIHRRWLAERPLDYSDQVRGRLEAGLYYPATHYLEAQSLRTRLTGQYLELAMGDCDVVHLPAIPVAVPTIAQTTTGSPADSQAMIAKVGHCMRALNYLGLPALCLPAGFCSQGLSIGFQLVGKPFDEATVLRMGHAFQSATQWHRQIPPLAAA